MSFCPRCSPPPLFPTLLPDAVPHKEVQHGKCACLPVDGMRGQLIALAQDGDRYALAGDWAWAVAAFGAAEAFALQLSRIFGDVKSYKPEPDFEVVRLRLERRRDAAIGMLRRQERGEKGLAWTYDDVGAGWGAEGFEIEQPWYRDAAARAEWTASKDYAELIALKPYLDDRRYQNKDREDFNCLLEETEAKARAFTRPDSPGQSPGIAESHPWRDPKNHPHNQNDCGDCKKMLQAGQRTHAHETSMCEECKALAQHYHDPQNCQMCLRVAERAYQRGLADGKNQMARTMQREGGDNGRTAAGRATITREDQNGRY